MKPSKQPKSQEEQLNKFRCFRTKLLKLRIKNKGIKIKKYNKNNAIRRKTENKTVLKSNVKKLKKLHKTLK